MRPFDYVRVTTAEDALRAAASAREARFIAGGTNLVDLMRLDVERPAQLIDITALPLTGVTIGQSGLRIGALARNSDVAWHDTVRKGWPALSEALLAGASPQLRNMATIGGNLLQRTRCPYFNDPALPCNKREPGSGCGALEGFNRMHAIFGGSDHCVAAHPSDMAVALVALDAKVRTLGAIGERLLPIESFHLLPGDTPERENALEPGELVIAVEVPNAPFAKRSHYVKVRDRASYAFALVSAAVALSTEGGRIRHARIAFGGVGTKPWRSLAAEQALAGASLDADSIAAAADAAVVGAKPLRYNAFKVELLRRTLTRALTELGETP